MYYSFITNVHAKERKKKRKKHVKFLCFSCYAGPLNSLKNSSKKTSDTVEVSFYDIKAIRDDLAFLKQDYLEFKQEIRDKLASLNASGNYACEWFPLNDNEEIQKFMKNDNGFQKRKDCLYLLLSSCDADTPRKFHDAFLNNVFSKEYLARYIWPHGW